MIECYRKEVRNIKTLTIRLDDELHRLFKIYAINKGSDMQALIIAFIKELVSKNQEE
ncbi:MAG: hypothetical protein FWD01_01730 [Defluviitaleaceae bacterium]|nr:hypothetical protein [Defluviitaleaceae bacterium]